MRTHKMKLTCLLIVTVLSTALGAPQNIPLPPAVPHVGLLPLIDPKPFYDVPTPPVYPVIVREPVGVSDNRPISHEMGAALMSAQNQDSGITAATTWLLQRVYTDPQLSITDKRNSLNRIMNGYNEYRHNRVDDPAFAKSNFEKEADYYVNTLAPIVIDLPTKMAGPYGPLVDFGFQQLIDHVNQSASQFLEPLSKERPAFLRQARDQEQDIYKSFVDLAQNSTSFMEIIKDGKFDLNTRVDPRMSKAAYFDHPVNKGLSEIRELDKKIQKLVEQNQKPDAPATETEAAKLEEQMMAELRGSFDGLMSQLEQKTQRLKAENDAASAMQLAQDIQQIGLAASNACTLVSFFIKDPEHKRTVSAVGAFVGTVAGHTASLVVNLTQMAPVLATGQFYLAVGVAVTQLITSLTQPSETELILTAINGIHTHLEHMENRLRNQLQSMENRLVLMSKATIDLLIQVRQDISALRFDVIGVKSHLNQIENLIRLSQKEFQNVELDKRSHDYNRRFSECYPPSSAKAFEDCLKEFSEMSRGAADTLVTGSAWTTELSWDKMPGILPPFFHQLGTIAQAARLHADSSLLTNGVGFNRPDGQLEIRPVNPFEWANVVNRFVLFTHASQDFISVDPEKYRATYNAIMTTGEDSETAFLKLGALKSQSSDPKADPIEEIKAGRGSNALLNAIANYQDKITTLKDGVRSYRTEFESEHLAGYPVHQEFSAVEPRREYVNTQQENKDRLTGGPVQVCGIPLSEKTERMKNFVGFKSARELLDAIDKTSLEDKDKKWQMNYFSDLSLLFPKSVRLHHDLSVPISSFFRQVKKLNNGVNNIRKLGICLEDLKWGHRFTVAQINNVRAIRNYLAKEVMDDEGVWNSCSNDEKSLIQKAHDRIASNLNHSGVMVPDDLMTLNSKDVALLDQAIALARNRGAGEYSRSNLLEIKHVYEFGSPVARYRVYYTVGNTSRDQENAVARFQLESKEAYQFAVASIPKPFLRDKDWDALFKELDAILNDSRYVPNREALEIMRAWGSRLRHKVPEITDPFTGRYFDGAHGNFRMNYFDQVGKPPSGNESKLIPSDEDKHAPLDKPLLFEALGNLLSTIKTKTDVITSGMKEGRTLTQEDLTEMGFSIIPPSKEEQELVSELETELRQYWSHARVLYDQKVSSVVFSDLSNTPSKAHIELHTTTKSLRSIMQALQAYTYLAFPTSSFADSSLQTALFDSEPRKNLIGESLLVDLRTKSLGRSWESEWEKKPSELVETYSKSSLDPDVNAGLYSENELTLGRLRDTLKDLSQRRSLREQVRTTSLNEKEKPVEPNEPNKENRESNPMIEQSIDILTAANTFLEAKLPKERIEAIEREIYNFLMERYGK